MHIDGPAPLLLTNSESKPTYLTTPSLPRAIDRYINPAASRLTSPQRLALTRLVAINSFAESVKLLISNLAATNQHDLKVNSHQ
uniref:Uncharacterized protein n=1 Tax=Leersia perrieri TaxID=77586 RepID=A0A0D9XG80_9ORYZ